MPGARTAQAAVEEEDVDAWMFVDRAGEEEDVAAWGIGLATPAPAPSASALRGNDNADIEEASKRD